MTRFFEKQSPFLDEVSTLSGMEQTTSLGMESLTKRLMRGFREALEIRDAADSIDSKYTFEIGDEVARLDLSGESPEFLLPVTDFKRNFEPPPPPQYFDFLSGIESMRDGGPRPDWSEAGKAYPIRGRAPGDVERNAYTQALNEKQVVTVLYDPGNAELFNFPEVPVYYSHTQPWHEEEQKRIEEMGRVIVKDDLSKYVALCTIDTFNPEKPLTTPYLMLVPHPASFLARGYYAGGSVDWDGETLEYRWAKSHYHYLSLRMRKYHYLTTRQTDDYLFGGHRNAYSYWLFYSNVDLPCGSLPGYRPSYGISLTITPPVKKGAIAGGSTPGPHVVDLDEETAKYAESDVRIMDDTGKMDLPKAALEEGDKIVMQVPVYCEYDQKGREGTILRGSIKRIPVVKSGDRLRPVWNEGPAIIFSSYDQLARSYWALLAGEYPRRVRRMETQRQQYDIVEALRCERFSEFRKVLHDKYGAVTTEEAVVALRHNGGMLSRFYHDRYVTSPSLPGVATPAPLWLLINTSSSVEISFTKKVTDYYLRQWIYLLRRNYLDCYWDYYKQVLVINDPWQPARRYEYVQVDQTPSTAHVVVAGSNEYSRNVAARLNGQRFLLRVPERFTAVRVAEEISKYVESPVALQRQVDYRGGRYVPSRSPNFVMLTTA